MQYEIPWLLKMTITNHSTMVFFFSQAESALTEHLRVCILNWTKICPDSSTADHYVLSLHVAFRIHAPMDVPYTDIPVKAFLTDTPEKVSDADTTVAALCDSTQVKVFHNDTKAKVFYIADAWVKVSHYGHSSEGVLYYWHLSESVSHYWHLGESASHYWYSNEGASHQCSCEGVSNTPVTMLHTDAPVKAFDTNSLVIVLDTLPLHWRCLCKH